MNNCDILIIGGGASGLIAAISAKKALPDVNLVIIEKNDRVGKKLLNTGNGRCNISNARISPEHYYSSKDDFFEYFDGFSFNDTADFFSDLGVVFRNDPDGKVYPYSLQASSVLDALRYECEKLGVVISCGERVHSVKKNGVEFEVNADSGVYACRAVIVAAGGTASEKLGGCRDGYDVLKGFGHKCTELYPCITAVKTATDLTKALKGIKSDVALTVNTGKNKKTMFGELLFTEYGISGPPVLQLSQMLHGKSNGAYFLIDFMPEYDFETVVSLIKSRNKRVFGDKLENLFVGMLNKRIGQVVVKSAGLYLSDSASELDEKKLRAIASQIKKFRLDITGVRGFEYAQVTGGGIELDKFNKMSMESLLCNGLFACGEVLDVTGDCGGFNLQWAWTSGYKAGYNAADYISR